MLLVDSYIQEFSCWMQKNYRHGLNSGVSRLALNYVESIKPWGFWIQDLGVGLGGQKWIFLVFIWKKLGGFGHKGYIHLD